MSQAVVSPVILPLGPRCSECGNTSLITNPEGFTVCPACGVMDDAPPYVVSDAFARAGGVIQAHAQLHPLGTRIGTGAERATVSDALLFAEKIAPTYQQEVFHRAHFAIASIVGNLHLAPEIVPRCEAAFQHAYKHLPRGTRARNIALLSLVTVARITGIPRARVIACLPAGRTLVDLRDVWLATAPYLPSEALLTRVKRLLSSLAAPPRACAIAYKLVRKHAGGHPHTKAAGIVLVAFRAAGIDHKRMPAYVLAQHAGVATSALSRNYDLLCINNPDLRRQVHVRPILAPKGLGASRVVSYLKHHPEGCTAQEIAIALQYDSARNILGFLAQLLKRGQVTRDNSRGPKATLWSLVTLKSNPKTERENNMTETKTEIPETSSLPKARGRKSRDPGRGDRIHAFLLRHPDGSTSQQVAEQCEINIGTAYVELNKLLEVGRATTIKGPGKHAPTKWFAKLPDGAPFGECITCHLPLIKGGACPNPTCPAKQPIPPAVKAIVAIVQSTHTRQAKGTLPEPTPAHDGAWDALSNALSAAGALVAPLAREQKFPQVIQLGKVIAEIGALLGMQTKGG